MRTVVERYYEQLFYVDYSASDDYFINQHTNGYCNQYCEF